jgi:hypothetical protein
MVLFMGVLYHLPTRCWRWTSSCRSRRRTCRSTSATSCSSRAVRRWPSSEHELAGDPTNWWAPNAACVEAMLRSCGLRIAERPGHEMWLCERA